MDNRLKFEKLLPALLDIEFDCRGLEEGIDTWIAVIAGVRESYPLLDVA